LEDDEEPADDAFKPDGGYIPRIFYLDPKDQKVRTDIYNKAGSDKYKYHCLC
jgi:protein-disulfide reductase (glutathione)